MAESFRNRPKAQQSRRLVTLVAQLQKCRFINLTRLLVD